MTKRPKIQEPDAISLLAPARATREAVRSDYFAPMVLFAPRRGQAMMTVLDGEGRLHEMLADVLEQMRRRLGPPLWIAVTTDAFTKPAPDVQAYEHGELAKAFADGDPTVTEQLVVILRQRGKPTEVASQSYRWIPSEGWEWDDPEEIEEYSGPVTDVLNKYII